MNKLTVCALVLVAMSVASCFGGLFDSALKAVSETANAVTDPSKIIKDEEAKKKADADSAARQKAYEEERAQEQKKAEELRKKSIEEDKARQKAYEEERAKERKEAEERRRRANEEERKKQEEYRKKQEEEGRRRDAELKAAREKREAEWRAKQAEESRQREEQSKRSAKFGLLRAAVQSYSDWGKGSWMGQLSDIEGGEQYLDGSVINGRVPLYKSITSGSTLAWVLRKSGLLDGSAEGRSYQVAMSGYTVPDTKCKGVSVNVIRGLSVYCSLSDVETAKAVLEGGEENVKALNEIPDLEVFGICRWFPDSVKVADALKSVSSKYKDLKMEELVEEDEVVCTDFIGFVRKQKCYVYKFENDVITGRLVGDSTEFADFDLNSKDASFLVYQTALESVKRTNAFKGHEFEKTFEEFVSEARAEVKSGRCKELLAKSKMRAGSGGRIDLNVENYYIKNEASKRTLEKHKRFCADEIKQAKDELISAKAEVASRVKEATGGGAPILAIYDKRAVAALAETEKNLAERKREAERKAKEKEKAAALEL